MEGHFADDYKIFLQISENYQLLSWSMNSHAGPKTEKKKVYKR